jgi:hypothetical protein
VDLLARGNRHSTKLWLEKHRGKDYLEEYGIDGTIL